jgi:5'-methylthioadenosine phosphorylase
MSYQIGVIGGSGLYSMEALEVIEERRLDTPFGEPSDPYILGRLDGVPVVFLARHGKGHRKLPTELNYRANIYGFKLLGVEQLISVSAVGSMKEQYEPRHIVVVDQFYDRTRHRPDTFFGEGLVAHVSMADPICPQMIPLMAEAAREAGAVTHVGGTYLCIEGPQFSTRGESRIYRSWGVDVIGMTNLQEAKLAREAEICYSAFAMVTDYDCWHDGEEAVTVEQVVAVLQENARKGQNAVRGAVRRLAAKLKGESRSCPCCKALESAIMTDRKLVPASTLEALRPIVGKYFP